MYAALTGLAALVAILIILVARWLINTSTGDIPLTVAYFLNGKELFRQTTTVHEMQKAGEDGFLRELRRQEGVVANGTPVRESLANGGQRMTIAVTYKGKAGSFTMVARAVKA